MNPASPLGKASADDWVFLRCPCVQCLTAFYLFICWLIYLVIPKRQHDKLRHQKTQSIACRLAETGRVLCAAPCSICTAEHSSKHLHACSAKLAVADQSPQHQLRKQAQCRICLLMSDFSQQPPGAIMSERSAVTSCTLLASNHPVEQSQELLSALPERQEDGDEGRRNSNEEAQYDLEFEIASAPHSRWQSETRPNNLQYDE